MKKIILSLCLVTFSLPVFSEIREIILDTEEELKAFNDSFFMHVVFYLKSLYENFKKLT